MSNLNEIAMKLESMSGVTLLKLRNLNRFLEPLKGKVKFKCTYQESYTDREGYEYPELVDIKFENWNNHFVSIRLSDYKVIFEGNNLQGEGAVLDDVIESQLSEYQDYLNHCALHDIARESNCIVDGEELVQLENITTDFWSSELQCIFTVMFSDGTQSDWFGACASDALKNAYSFNHGKQAVLISLSGYYKDFAGAQPLDTETIKLLSEV